MKRQKTRAKRPPQKEYTVWIDQINRTVLTVKATDIVEAQDKAVRKWRREDGWPRVTDIKVE